MSPASLPLRCNRLSPKTDERQGSRSFSFRSYPAPRQQSCLNNDCCLCPWHIHWLAERGDSSSRSTQMNETAASDARVSSCKTSKGCRLSGCFAQRDVLESSTIPNRWAAVRLRPVGPPQQASRLSRAYFGRFEAVRTLARPCAVGMGPAAIGDSPYRFW